MKCTECNFTCEYMLEWNLISHLREMRWTGCKRKRLNLYIIWTNRTGKLCRSVGTHICALFKAYSGEQAWKAIGDRLQWPSYLSRVEHERNIRNMKQRTDIRKYSYVNRTIRLWNRLPAEILGALSCKPNAFRKRVRRVIDLVNWRKCEWVVNDLKRAVNCS